MNVLQKVEALLSRPISWPIHREAVRLIAGKENCFLIAYLCPAKVWTCGWGETDGVRNGTRWTQAQADERFRVSLEQFSEAVQKLLKVPASPQQLGALVSLMYNIGLSAFGKSSVLRLHNAGDFEAAARAFGLWNKARVNGVLTVLPGLTSRRAAEASLYLAPDVDGPEEVMPQAVAAESKLTESPLAKLGAGVAGGGGLIGTTSDPVTTAAPSAIAQVTQGAQHTNEVASVLNTAIGSLRGIVDGVASMFGLSSTGLAGFALVAAGAAVVYWRWKQRREGWA